MLSRKFISKQRKQKVLCDHILKVMRRYLKPDYLSLFVENGHTPSPNAKDRYVVRKLLASKSLHLWLNFSYIDYYLSPVSVFPFLEASDMLPRTHFTAWREPWLSRMAIPGFWRTKIVAYRLAYVSQFEESQMHPRCRPLGLRCPRLVRHKFASPRNGYFCELLSQPAWHFSWEETLGGVILSYNRLWDPIHGGYGGISPLVASILTFERHSQADSKGFNYETRLTIQSAFRLRLQQAGSISGGSYHLQIYLR